ncbi:hypothetical protein RHGRI_024040 [Rhododendron griersonianum]|uniref:Transmembrane protein adipocyte-associated 1 n=1 Tax=Rhododendron griersonianum TaxID=479676 RepID=A0AAV6JBB8_9ERIC|nr:hypothetical protein RHGRI_024040 [Rhododendron griersonianum]
MTTTQQQQQQQQGLEITRSLSPTSISHSKIDLSLSSSECHGFWRDAALAVPAALFVLYLAFHAKKNLRKLSNGRNYVTIAYYALLWLAALLNLAWCSLQAWQCSSGKEVAWNLLSLFTTAGILCLEISLMAFLIQENHSTGFETLARAFTLSGFIVGVDILLKAAELHTCCILKELSQLLVAWLGMFWQLFRGSCSFFFQRGSYSLLQKQRNEPSLSNHILGYVHLSVLEEVWQVLLPLLLMKKFAIFVFGFRVPLFVDSEETTHRMKWGLWTVSKILLAAVYGFILFVHSSKWQDKLPSRPMFYNYVVAMFVTNAVALFACALAGIGLTYGLWLYNLTLFCYHCLYLPFLYITFSADIFQEEDLRLDNAYYSEMKDAGFFDVDWD